MAATSILPPFPHFKEADGTPLNNGYVYIGDPGVDAEANPATVYFDLNLAVTASQPIRTVNGYFSNAGNATEIYVNAANFSIKVLNSDRELVFEKLNYELALPFSSFEYQPEATGSLSRDVTSKLSEIVSVKDFGAVGDGVTDDSAAFTAAEALSQEYIYLPAGTYIVTGLTLTKQYWGEGQIELDSTLEDRFFDETQRALEVDSDMFTDSGAVNAYVLTKTNGRPYRSYEDGMPVRFNTSNTNTSGTVTVNVDSIGPASVTLPGGGSPQAGDIGSSFLNTIVYNLANTRFEIQKAPSDVISLVATASSITSNGYIDIATGNSSYIRVQWGSVVATTTLTNHNLPTPFATAFYSIVSGVQNQLVDVRIASASLSQFNIQAGTATPSVGWIAIGV